MDQHFKKSLLLIFPIALLCFWVACKKPVVDQLSYVNTGNGAGTTVTPVDTLPSFNSPHGLTLDAAGNIYVADYGNNLIRKITPAGVVSTFAGNGNAGSVNAAAALSSFNGPTAIAIDGSGNFYIADALNNLVRKITPAGAVSTLAGADTTGYTNGTGTAASFWAPAGLTVDGSGNVYVADAGNNVIRLITPAGVVSTFAGNGNPGIENGPLDSAAFYNPTGITLDKQGNLLVADYLNNSIRRITPAGIVNTLAGTGAVGANNGADSTATFYFPSSVAVDATGNIYIADEVNNLIRKISNGTISTFAGSGAQGAADSTGTAASFNAPTGVAVDAAGNVYVADSNNNLIRKITTAGVVSTVAGTGAAGSKNGVAIARRNKQTLKAATKQVNVFYYKKRS